MIEHSTARAALDKVWQAMVELAENGNDAIVDNQRKLSAKTARKIATTASDLSLLSQAAVALVRYCGERPG